MKKKTETILCLIGFLGLCAFIIVVIFTATFKKCPCQMAKNHECIRNGDTNAHP